jgi:hypothetical protein
MTARPVQRPHWRSYGAGREQPPGAEDLVEEWIEVRPMSDVQDDPMTAIVPRYTWRLSDKILRFSPDAAVEKWPLRGSPATSRRCHWPMLPRQSVCSSPMDIGVRRYAGEAGHVRWSERALPGTAEWQL